MIIKGLVGSRTTDVVTFVHDFYLVPIKGDSGIREMTFKEAATLGIIKKVSEEDQDGVPLVSWEVPEGTAFLKSVDISLHGKNDRYAVPLLARSAAPRYCFGMNMFSIEETAFDGHVHVLSQEVIDSLGIIATAPKSSTIPFIHGVKVEGGSHIRTATLRSAINTEFLANMPLPEVTISVSRAFEL